MGNMPLFDLGVARRGGAYFLSGLALLGCSQSLAVGAQTADGKPIKRSTEIVHEPCDTSSAGERLDANGDGKPEVLIVYAGGRELCRSVDLNFDGTVDLWVYRDPQGQVRRREFDFDRDGRIDEIEILQAGVPVERYRATTLANRIDTWDFFQGGQLVRTERDSKGDGIVDQWWEYSRPGCPIIHSDTNGDGRPDPGATVDYCKETGYVPPERTAADAPRSPTFQRPGDELPTETENKPQ
jgi:hypothetical protein